MTTHNAACQCGALSAKFDGDPDFAIVCNCQACQRRTGAPFGTGTYFRKSQMTVDGATKQWARDADSGRSIENFFCPTCGTTLYWTLEMRPDYIGVGYGSFQTQLPDPIRAIWTEEKHDWITFPDDLPSFQKGSPEP